MKVLMVAPSAIDGGSEALLLELARQGGAAGFESVVLVLQDGPLVSHLAQAGIHVETRMASRIRNAFGSVQTMLWIASQIRRHRPDIVYANMPKAHLYSALPARLAGVPSVWHQASVPRPPHWMDRLASALPAARVMAVSSDGAAAQRRLHPGPDVTVVQPGIDLELYAGVSRPAARRELGLEPDAVYVGIVGRLQEWKGQEPFLRAAAIVGRNRPEVRFVVVGGALLGWEGDYPQRLEYLAAELGLGDRVMFTGHRTDVPLWFAAFDVAVNASDPEPFGLVIVEAMAAGTAVVAIRAGGPADVIEHRRTGLLCDALTPEALAAAIGELLDDEALRAQLSAAGRDVATDRYGGGRMAKDFAALLASCVQEKVSR